MAFALALHMCLSVHITQSKHAYILNQCTASLPATQRSRQGNKIGSQSPCSGTACSTCGTSQPKNADGQKKIPELSKAIRTGLILSTLLPLQLRLRWPWLPVPLILCLVTWFPTFTLSFPALESSWGTLGSFLSQLLSSSLPVPWEDSLHAFLTQACRSS